jgi:ABC-type amino acid transport substrate-binding protein/heat shock protein HslJ
MTSSPPTENLEGETKRRSPWLIVGGVLAIVVVLALVWMALGGGTPEPTPEPTLAPTAAAGGTDPVCERVDASGTIVVGTSGDYPPFEYFNDEYRLDGFDIALMDAIGGQLNVAVEFKDYAFDGLNGALQLGEIDAAVAAITVTEAREAVVDFTDGYYFGVGAAVARSGAEPSAIAIPGDFAGWRVGVERGSVYQSWAEANLIAPGIIPDQQLFAYERAQDALRDLEQTRLDVVLLDEAAAQAETADGALAIVGEGAVAQVYAIAIPQEAACIRARLNAALAALAAQGTIDEIAREYIGVISNPIPQPTATPEAPAETPTPPPPAACIDSSAFVMDLTYDDEGGTEPPTVQPSENFTKGWRIRNSGTCPWSSGYRLSYARGNNEAARMDGESVPVEGDVAPGQTYDFYADLNAPSGVFGIMQGFWQMQNPADVFFGETVWVMVEVVEPPAPTAPPPTATTAPEATQVPPTATPPEATQAPPPTQEVNPLEGRTFGFYAIYGQPTIPGAVPALTFGPGGALSGSDGCNTFSGSYTVQPAGSSQGALSIVVGPGTALACPEDVTTQAQAFRVALGLVSAYVYPPRSLVLVLLDSSAAEILSGQLP